MENPTPNEKAEIIIRLPALSESQVQRLAGVCRITYEVIHRNSGWIAILVALYVGQSLPKTNVEIQTISPARVQLHAPVTIATKEKEVALPSTLPTTTKNEAAPFVMPVADNNAYIKRFSKVAISEMQKYGVPASISLAQGLIESRAGTSKLAVSNNNHFGIKCFSRRCKKGHCSNFTDDTHKDFFRKFAAPWDSWRHHSVMLSKGRYKPLHKYGRDYRKWAIGLKRLGYATDPKYDITLIGIIENYELWKYDH